MDSETPLGRVATAPQDYRERQILAAEIRLLYESANVGVVVTIVAASLLGYLQWGSVPHGAVFGWLLYMLVTAAIRLQIARHGRREGQFDRRAGWTFAFGAGLSAAGWGAAGILLYPSDFPYQVLLAFVLGGMILGAASLLAPRPEAFVSFILLAGLPMSCRLTLERDPEHVAMGVLATIFVLAAILTTRRIHRTIESSLRLQFTNRDLVDQLQAANKEAEVLNRQLELRVHERTAELERSTELLRAEMARRSQMEAELLQARKMESLGVLAGGIAHDFNNFLTVLQGNIELAKLELTSSHPAREILGRTAGACRRAAFLSSQLLTFARGGAPVRRVVALGPLIREAVQLLRPGAAFRVHTEIPDNLWCVEVDAVQIGQAIHNVLLNARQAMPEGGIIEVKAGNAITANRRDADTRECVRISIRDDGPGIPDDVLPRIFDPYFTTKPEGSGLGLATAYSVISKHGGHIAVESGPAQGTVFTIELPAVAPAAAPAPPVAESETLRGGTGRVLVMDDEEGLRRLLGDLLTGLGYEVQTARDGAEAIASYEAAHASGRRFDVVLLDLTVSGGMGGAEAARRLREFDPSARLIVSSGYSHAPVLAEFSKYGFDAVVPKPWTLTQISEVFESVLVHRKDDATIR